MKPRLQSAFTLIEMLVVISIIAILAAFAVPALTSALTRGQLTGTMNNARQVFLAGQQMALDGTANSDPSLGWPGDVNPAVGTVSAYVDLLVKNNYLQAGDVQKLFTAPSAAVTVTGGTTSGSPPAYTPIAFGGGSVPALKIYRMQDANPGSTLFCVTNNWVYDNDLSATANPYSTKGFVVIRKGGDASVFKRAQAQHTTASPTGTVALFQSLVGRLPGDLDGAAGTEATGTTGNTLSFP